MCCREVTKFSFTNLDAKHCMNIKSDQISFMVLRCWLLVLLKYEIIQCLSSESHMNKVILLIFPYKCCEVVELSHFGTKGGYNLAGSILYIFRFLRQEVLKCGEPSPVKKVVLCP